MTRILVARGFALWLALVGVLFGAASPAQAQKRNPPQITLFEMEPLDRVTAGGEMFFRMHGTAGGRATVRVTGVNRTIVLHEVDAGVYEGGHTIRPNDRVSARSMVTGTLRKQGLNAFARIPVAAVAVVTVPQPQAQPRPPVLAIQRFAVAQVERIEPGTELRFTLDGTPGQRAVFTIEGVAANLPMREVRPGHYEATYTVRLQDRNVANAAVIAALEGAGGAAVRAELRRGSLLADNRPPVLRNLSPRDNDTVTDAGQVVVSATFDDQSGSGVNPESVRVSINGRDVTPAAVVTREHFTYRADLAPGNYNVDVQLRDAAGNASRTQWNFLVRSQVPPPPTTLPLEFTSHTDQATVGPGRVEVRGRTAPGAALDVEVIGLASVPGSIGLTHRLLNQRIIADAQGRFWFEFTPQVHVPGIRYEVEVRAAHGSLARTERLTLQTAR